VAEHAGAARVGEQQRPQDPHQRGLAAAVRSDDAGRAAWLQREVEWVQSDPVGALSLPPAAAGRSSPPAEALGDSFQLDGWLGHTGFSKLRTAKKKGRAVRPHGPGSCSGARLYAAQRCAASKN